MKMHLITLSLLAVAAGLNAQVLAIFGGDYVTTNQVLQGNSDASLGNDQFSPTTQRQPVSNYSGPVFFAGLGIIGTPTISASNTNVLQHASGFDPIQFGLSGGTAARTLAGVIMFNVSGWSPANQDIQFSVRGMTSIVGGAYGGDELRLIVRSGSDYFVSTNSGTFGIAGGTVSFTATDWLSYAPETSILGAFGVTPVSSLSSIDAVGVYYKGIQIAQATSTSFRPQFYELSVTAVPEPATYVALLGALALGFVVLRRHRG